MFLKSGRFMSNKERKGMFARLNRFKDDPKEVMLSDKIAMILEGKTDIKYHAPEVLVLTGSTAGGSYGHIFTKKDPAVVLEYAKGGVNYNLSYDDLIGAKKQTNQYTNILRDNLDEEEFEE